MVGPSASVIARGPHRSYLGLVISFCRSVFIARGPRVTGLRARPGVVRLRVSLPCLREHHSRQIQPIHFMTTAEDIKPKSRTAANLQNPIGYIASNQVPQCRCDVVLVL